VPAKPRPKVPDWEDLRFFLEAHRTGSLTQAARALGVEHTTVSRRIAALEASLGVRLFDRTPRGYEPTAAAQELRPLADRVEEQVLAIERRADPGRDLTGVVRIATSNQLATDFVVPALPAFRARHPGITIELSAENRDIKLSRREADLALRMGRMRERGLVTRKLADLAHAFYARRAGRAAPALDLDGDVFVGFDDSLAHLEHSRWLDRIAPARKTAFRANTIHCLHAAIRSGLGVGILPCFVGDADPSLVRLDAAEAPAPRELWLLVHGELRRSARIRAVLDCLVERADAMRPSFEGRAPAPPPAPGPARPARG
jgi:DNA-binding transcriptional LysR family regulator